MRTPASHSDWLRLIGSFKDSTGTPDGWTVKEVNEILNEIYPDFDFDKFPTIHRSVCETCKGNIIKFDSVEYHSLVYQDLAECIFEFHYKTCERKKKLIQLNAKRS